MKECSGGGGGEKCVAKVFFVRHGESEYNAVRRIQGWRDIPLNERGRQQAAAVAKRLADEVDASRVVAVVSSSLQRASETAGFVLKALKRDDLTVKTHDGLREICFGPMEGTYLAAVPPGVDAKANEHNMEVFREIWAQWRAGNHTVAVPGGETPIQLVQRARAAVAETLSALFPTPVLFVSNSSSPLLLLLFLMLSFLCTSPPFIVYPRTRLQLSLLSVMEDASVIFCPTSQES